MKLLTVTMPEAEDVELLDPMWQAMLIALSAQWAIVGRRNINARKMANALVNDLFIVPGEVVLDENGDPKPESPMPTGWELVCAHKINHQRDVVRYDPDPPVTIAADQITDDVIDHSHNYPRHYVRPVVDNTDPENPVVTGVTLLDRFYNPIVQSYDETDPENPVPIYEISGVAPDASGRFKKKWTTPGKNVAGVGVVPPESLEDDGTYVHQTYTATVVEPAMTELVPMSAQARTKYLDHMPDLPDQVDVDGNVTSWKRPTEVREIVNLAGYKRW